MRLSIGNSFAHKMTLMALLASSMASATLMFAFLAFDSFSSHAQLQSRLTTLANIVGQNSSAALNFDDNKAAAEILQALHAEPSIVSACLYSQSGNVFAQYRRAGAAASCPRRLSEMETEEPGFVEVTRVVEQHDEYAGTLLLKSDLEEINKRWNHLLQITCLLLLLALLVGGVAGSLLQRKISKPVREFSAAMDEVTEKQNFSSRVSVAGSDEIARLGAGFNTMLAELEKRDFEKKAFEAQLRHQALNDELTGLPNRRLLADCLSLALAVAEERREKVALVYIDLDGFKLVNDSLGHAVGDLLLCKVADRLLSQVQQAGTLGRLGGDEFAVVVLAADAHDEAERIAAALLEVLAASFQIEGHEITISASIGISCYPDNGADGVQLLQQADSAMYGAKRTGKNRMMFFSEELGDSARERMNLETELRTAIPLGQIFVHYQPEFDIRTRQLVRFETLARWIHPSLGMIPPDKFIPIAEETGLIVSLGAYVMECACREAIKWQRISPHPVQVAVNVSSIQFVRDSFVDEVAEVLRVTGLPANLLQIELTESVMLTGTSYVAAAMRRLSALGVGLAIDDFGTGYSCLGYLPNLPFDALKIDRSFVKDLGERPEIEAMVHALVMLAHKLGMRVIAEGIETTEQLDLIGELGADEIQGYLVGRPTPNPASYFELQSDPAKAAEIA